MRAFGRRKVLSLATVSALALLFCLFIVLLFTVPHNAFLANISGHVADIQQVGTSIVHAEETSNDRILTSACLPRHTLNSDQVKLFSNRKLNKQYYLTIGIPTISRKVGDDYLMKTLNSLLNLDQNGQDSMSDILIVLQLGDPNEGDRLNLAKRINNIFHKFIKTGVIDIIQVLPGYYPLRGKLKKRFGDSEVRIKWRSKQVVDFAFLFCYCYGLSKYHLQLEDDVIAAPQYFLKLKDFIAGYEAKEAWYTLDASVLGYIGKVYHNHDLKEMATFYYLFFDEMPVDWLEYNWRDIKGQQGRWRFRVASLFQHIGLVSSMAHKTQKAREHYFDEHIQKFMGYNPPAKLYTDISGQMSTKIEHAYEKGGGFFWGTCSDKVRCFVKIIFPQAVTVKRIAIETGTNFAANDTIHVGSLESGRVANGEDCLHYDSRNPMKFKNGKLDVMFSKDLSVSCFKITVEKQREWVCLREINVWKTQDNS